MDLAWFIYSIAIIAIMIAACAVSATIWVLTERKDSLVAMGLFLAYALDIGIILFDEYHGNKPMLMDYLTGGLTHPVAQIALKAAVVLLVWVWLMMRTHAVINPKRIVLPALLFVGVFTWLAPVGDVNSRVQTLRYWAFYDLSIISAFIWVVWHYKTQASEAEKLDMNRQRKLFFVLFALSIVMLIEDIINIWVWTPDPSGVMYDFFWHLTERNLTENIIMVIAAVGVIVYSRDVIRVFSSHPNRSSEAETRNNTRGDFEGRLLRFADDHGVSARERDILSLALQGKSTQNIASALFISTGTVKAHMHRIYKKCNAATRKELVNSFWKY